MSEPEADDRSKRLHFIPGDYEDVVFIVSDRRLAWLVRLVAPVIRLWFRIRRATLR